MCIILYQKTSPKQRSFGTTVGKGCQQGNNRNVHEAEARKHPGQGVELHVRDRAYSNPLFYQRAVGSISKDISRAVSLSSHSV